MSGWLIIGLMAVACAALYAAAWFAGIDRSNSWP